MSVMEQHFACGFHYMHMYNVQLIRKNQTRTFAVMSKVPTNGHVTSQNTWTDRVDWGPLRERLGKSVSTEDMSKTMQSTWAAHDPHNYQARWNRSGWPPTNVSCCGGRVYPPYHTQSIKGHETTGPIKKLLPAVLMNSTGLKSGSIFVIHQTNSVIAMLLKKSSVFCLFTNQSAHHKPTNHNAIRELRLWPL